MTDEANRTKRAAEIGAIDGQGNDVTLEEQERAPERATRTEPDWVPETLDSQEGGPTDTAPGSWGNRSGAGSGGQGERELQDDESSSGFVTDDITGSPGTNG